MSGLRKSCKAPCKQCPFLRNSLPGYLGEDSPDEFIATTHADHPMPCHSTVDYTDHDWKMLWDRLAGPGKLCAGALIYFANICKISRWPDRPRRAADKVKVFATPTEFLKHHKRET